MGNPQRAPNDHPNGFNCPAPKAGANPPAPVIVDRTSVWGNPFIVGVDGDRDTVITNYEKHYLPHKPSQLARLHEIAAKTSSEWGNPMNDAARNRVCER
jgi:hypothetical protein